MLRRLAAVAAAVTALLGANAAPAHATAHGFRLVFADGFNQRTPLGSFSGCDHNDGSKAAYCSGLTGTMRAGYWAYPEGWPDTATEWGYRVGGVYDPASTMWVAPSAWGDGQLHIKMWRGGSGPVHSAALVPMASIGLKYGRVEERFRVSHAAPGYKSAHLLWPDSNSSCPNCEVDFPEGDWATGINAYAHHRDAIGGDQDAYDARAQFTVWHTADIEWTPGSVTFLLDGRVVGHSTTAVPDQPMSWIIQNETSLDSAPPAPNSWAQMDISWIKVWDWS